MYISRRSSDRFAVDVGLVLKKCAASCLACGVWNADSSAERSRVGRERDRGSVRARGREEEWVRLGNNLFPVLLLNFTHHSSRGSNRARGSRDECDVKVHVAVAGFPYSTARLRPGSFFATS